MGVRGATYRLAALLLCCSSMLLSAQPERTHEVERKETAYGIARQYGVDLNALFDLNPWAESGIRKGDVLRLPTGSESASPQPISTQDSLGMPLQSVEEKEEVPETDHGQVDTFPRDMARRRPVPPTWAKDTVRVAVFLPFHAGRDSLGRQEERLRQIARDCAAGIRVALDSGEVMGSHFDVRFLDSGQDTSGAMLCAPEQLWPGRKVDIALGPLKRSRFLEVRGWPGMDGAAHVALTDLGGKLAEGEPGVIMPYPQVEARMHALAEHVAQQHRGERVLFLATGDIRNLDAEAAFRNAWFSLEVKDSLLLMDEVEVESKGLGSLRDSLTDVRRNVLVVPGGKANRSLAGVLQTEMQLGDTMDFRLYADEAWAFFRFLDFDVRERVGFTVVDGYGSLPDSSAVAPFDSTTFCVAQSMANMRGGDPGAYGWLAHDVTRDVMMWTAGHGRDWTVRLAAGERLIHPNPSASGQLHRFHWQSVARGNGGLINGATRILRQEDFQWVEVAHSSAGRGVVDSMQEP